MSTESYCFAGMCAPADLWVASATFALVAVTFGLALYTAKLYRATVKLGRDAEATSARQAGEMADSIEQSRRSANQMARVADSMEVSARAATESVETLKSRTALQLRPFMTVQAGTPWHQSRASSVHFQTQIVLVNAGSTPALKVGYRVDTKILPFPLPQDFNFPLPDEPEGEMAIGTQQTIFRNSEPVDFIEEEAVAEVMDNRGKALFSWGIVSYSDIFGDKHETTFCHRYVWVGTGQELRHQTYFESRFTRMT